MITWPLAGILTESYGWYSAFYVPAAVCAIVTVFWFAVVYGELLIANQFYFFNTK